MTLDLKHIEAGDVLARLLTRADVLVQNLAPGAADRLGLSYQQLHAKFPRLIVCDISGYGGDGPYRNKKAYDLLVQSESGFLSVTGTSAEAARAGIPIADISAGMYAYSGILAALISAKNPEKAVISTSLCWKAWWNGCRIPCITHSMGQSLPPGPELPTLRSIPTAPFCAVTEPR